ncbi:hypothetical protein [Lagierella sp.]|uniref:hypothetical protein n=1 Tax=Lagierella sp. TaxID=2849657 RepID=UPI002616F903|nr:hypothetical protein [Lagierella sp.]
MKKLLLGALLIGSVLLVGCDKADTPAETDGNDPTTTTEESVDTEATETTEATDASN